MLNYTFKLAGAGKTTITYVLHDCLNCRTLADNGEQDGCNRLVAFR